MFIDLMHIICIIRAAKRPGCIDSASTLTSQCRFKTPDPVFMNSGLHPDQNLKFDLEDALNRAIFFSPITLPLTSRNMYVNLTLATQKT
jgi:hypothetical protein